MEDWEMFSEDGPDVPKKREICSDERYASVCFLFLVA